MLFMTCYTFCSQTEDESVTGTSRFVQAVGRNKDGRYKVMVFREDQDVRSIVQDLFRMLGRYHEHIRPDRDTYIQINWENINPRKMKEFGSLLL